MDDNTCHECGALRGESGQCHSCGWRHRDFSSNKNSGSLKGGILDTITFDEQFDALKVSYPNDARVLTAEVKAGWWKVLNAVKTSHFVQAIIRARESSPNRCPTLPVVERCAREVAYEAQRSNVADYMSFEGIEKSAIRNVNGAVYKKITKDIFSVLKNISTSEKSTPKKWRALAERYKHVLNTETGGTFGVWFEERAVYQENLDKKHEEFLERRAAEKAEEEKAKREELQLMRDATMKLAKRVEQYQH